MGNAVLRRLGTAAGALALALASAACSAGADIGGDNPAPARTSESGGSSEPSHGPESGERSADRPGRVSQEQAATIVTDRYGGRVLNVESDTSDGEPTWEVEVADSDQGRIEVNVAKASGDVVEFEHD